jgi:hypothetical protein
LREEPFFAGLNRRYNDNVLEVNVKEDEMTDEVVAKVNRHYASAADWRIVGTTEVTGIVFPDQGELRSRKVVKRSNARPTGKYPSWKMGRMLQWESRNELNAFLLLDCDPEVTRFNEQPCEITYVLDGVARRHYPDILVETNGRKELWEVKPESKAAEPEVATRSALLIRSLPIWGYTYRVVLAKDLAGLPRLDNAKTLLHFGGKYTVTVSEWEFIRLALKRYHELSWSKACSGDYGLRGREILCSLALKGYLTVHMDSPMNSTTRFFARRGGL